MEKQMHLAAQYLAAAGISFLEKKSDDSHTNLGFSTENGCLYTHPLSKNGEILCLDYEKFSLEWKSKQNSTTFRLDGATHREVLEWLIDTSQIFLNKEYRYKFHYDLPYTVDDLFTFKLNDSSKLTELMHERNLAQFVLEKIENLYKLSAPIRIWPHHFDTGIYSDIPDSNISVGLGLATPDAISNNSYLYLTGYKNGSVIDTTGFPLLTSGEWKNDDFKGAILDTTNIVESDGVEFFQEAINQLNTSLL